GEENLLTGAYSRGALGAGLREDLEKVYAYFPRLKERRHSQSGYTSGGEQQMTAIGRALMARPRMILLDEPSMGLAPQLVEEIFEIVQELNRKEGESLLLAEQTTNIALKYAGYGSILADGRVVTDVRPEKINAREALARLPITRKADVACLQKELPPLGGLNATPVEKLAKLFVSPGPIYEPEGRGADWWRTARGLFAGGFRAGERVANTFAYHFTPAGSMLES